MWDPPPPPPPPHPAQRATLSIATARGAQARLQARRRPASSFTPIAAASAHIHIQIQGPAGGFGLIRTAEGAVVVTETENDPGMVTDVALGVQVASDGAPVQARLADPVRPSGELRLRLYVAVPPAVTVCEVEEPEAAATEKLWIVKFTGLEAPPPGVGLVTIIG